MSKNVRKYVYGSDWAPSCPPPTRISHSSEFRPFFEGDPQSFIQIMSLSLISPVTQLRALRECFSSTSFWLLSSRIWQKHDSGVLLTMVLKAKQIGVVEEVWRYCTSWLEWCFFENVFRSRSSSTMNAVAYTSICCSFWTKAISKCEEALQLFQEYKRRMETRSQQWPL
jgi:hypothetical protein